MNAAHLGSSARLRSIYARSIPTSQAEALHRRRALEAQQRRYRDNATDWVGPPPLHARVPPGLRVQGWVR
jgi:hypothetical protein